MGTFHETDRMIKHRQQCDICKAATTTTTYPEFGEYSEEVVHYIDCCDEYGDMFNNVIDFESGDGPWEDKPEGWLMCNECDGPIDPNAGRCEACGYQWCTEDVHTCSSSDCDEVELCGKPAVETVGGRPCCEEHKL
jgi:hypothetical protein